MQNSSVQRKTEIETFGCLPWFTITMPEKVE